LSPLRPWEFGRDELDLAEWYELKEVMGWFNTYYREEKARQTKDTKRTNSGDSDHEPRRSRTI